MCICSCVCMCAWVSLWVCWVCAWVKARGWHPVSFSITASQFLRRGFCPNLELTYWLDRLADKLCVSSCPLPSSEITDLCHSTKLLKWVWGFQAQVLMLTGKYFLSCDSFSAPGSAVFIVREHIPIWYYRTWMWSGLYIITLRPGEAISHRASISVLILSTSITFN